MNFKVNKKELLDNLNILSRGISSTTPLPSLTGIKFSALDDELILISSDSNISIKVSINNKNGKVIDILEPGEIVIEAKYILEIVRKIDASEIGIEIIDGTLIKIYGGNSEFKINCMKASDYPEINFNSNGKPFTLKSNIFKEIIDQTAFACSTNETRPVLTGVNFEASGKKLKVNATDSYRLARKIIDIDEENEFNITVPAKYLMDVYHSIEDDKELSIIIDNQKILFNIDNILIQTRLLDDQFPDTSRLIPTSFNQTLTINSKELIRAIDRASFIKSDGKNIVKLSISKEKVNITANNQTSSSFENIGVILFTGTNFDISCSGKYLQDALSSFNSNELTISFSGDLKPMIITSKDDESLIQLISPVRTMR